MDTLKDKVCGWLVSGSNTPGVMCCTAGAAKSAAAHIGGDASVEPLIRLSEAQAAIAELTRERDELAQQRGDLLQRVLELEFASEWRPIETAPKDGTYILVTNEGSSGAWVARWKPVAVSGYRFECPWRSVMLNHDHIPEDSRYLPPTLWMPLPPAPKTESQA